MINFAKNRFLDGGKICRALAKFALFGKYPSQSLVLGNKPSYWQISRLVANKPLNWQISQYNVWRIRHFLLQDQIGGSPLRSEDKF